MLDDVVELAVAWRLAVAWLALGGALLVCCALLRPPPRKPDGPILDPHEGRHEDGQLQRLWIEDWSSDSLLFEEPPRHGAADPAVLAGSKPKTPAAASATV